MMITHEITRSNADNIMLITHAIGTRALTVLFDGGCHHSGVACGQVGGADEAFVMKVQAADVAVAPQRSHHHPPQPPQAFDALG